MTMFLKTSFFVVILGLGIPTARAQAPSALDEAEQVILRKLAEDRAYFAWRVKQVGDRKAAAAEIKKIGKENFQKEVDRANTMIPVLDYIINTAEKTDSGERIALSRVKSPIYEMLGAYLNLIGTVRSKQYSRAKAFADKIDLKVGFGKTQSMEDFMDVLTRHLYYLNGLVRYHLHEDQEAVAWFGQIYADTEVRAMNLEKKRDLVNKRLADLHKLAVAVASFGNLTKADKDAWIGTAIAEILVNDLSNLTGLKLIERQRVTDLIDEVVLGQMGIVSEDDAAKLGSQLGAGTMVVGTYSVKDDVFTVTGRLVHVESGTILASSMKEGSEATVIPTSREMALELLQKSGILTVSETRKIEMSDVPKQAAVKAVTEAKMLLASKPDEARALFEKAMKSDPAYANAFEELRMRFKDVSAQVAIMPFSNTTNHREDDWMKEGIAESLNTDIEHLGFSTVERLQLKQVVQMEVEAAAQQQEVGADPTGDGKEASVLGNKVAANFMVVGSFQRFSDQLKVNARFVDVESAQILWAGSVQGAYATFAGLLGELVGKLGRHLNRPIDAEQMAKMVEGKPSVEDYKKFMLKQVASEELALDKEKEERQAAREADAKTRLQAQLKAQLDQSKRDSQTREWIGIGALSGGALIGLVAQIVAVHNTGNASRFRTLAKQAIRSDDIERFSVRQQGFESQAIAWNVVSAVGLVAAAGGAVFWYLSSRGPDLDLDAVDLTLGPAVGSIMVAPNNGGVEFSYGMSW